MLGGKTDFNCDNDDNNNSFPSDSMFLILPPRRQPDVKKNERKDRMTAVPEVKLTPDCVQRKVNDVGVSKLKGRRQW